jgi:hypothetical protein
MKSLSSAGRFTIRQIFIFCTMGVISLLVGCGGSDSPPAVQETQYGSVSLRLQFEETTVQEPKAGVSRLAEDPDICTDANIDTINVQIFWPDGQPVADVTWACSEHGGIIHNVPEGNDFSIDCSGTVDGQVLWRGEVDQVAVLNGQTTQVGTVAMHYMGGDHTPPELLYTLPASGAGGVALNSSIVAVFNEPIAASSVSDSLFVVTATGVPMTGRIEFSRSLSAISFTPDDNLTPSTAYAVTVDSNGPGGTGIQDSAGNVCSQDYSWNFTTASTVDSRAPQVNGTIPGDGADNVNESTVISVSFDEPLNPGLVNDGAFTVTSGQDTVRGRTAYDSQTYTLSFTPDEPLAYLTDYSVTLGDGIQDMAGNLMEGVPYSWGFRTVATHLTYTISAVGAVGGSIRPAGDVIVDSGDSAPFEIEADQGYYLADLIVDGHSVAPAADYEFTAISQDHTIKVIFAPVKFVDNQVAASGNGQTWQSAFKSIQEAVDQSNPGDEIWISTGTYAVSSPIVVNKTLTLRGGFAGTEIHPGQRSADGTTAIDGNQSVGCMRVTAEARFENLTFNNGTSAYGGGLYCTARATLENCILSDCTADYGGGVYSTRQLDLTACRFSNDQALDGAGGAVFIQGQENSRAGLHVFNCQFVNNTSFYDDYPQGGLFGGGAIFSDYSDALLISDSSFSQNQAFHGGALYLVNGNTASIDGCRFEVNSSRNPAGLGGAIYDKDCILQVSDSNFTGNGGFDGGAIFAHPSAYDSQGVSVISHAQFSDNASPGDGAAVHIEEGHIRIINSLFYANVGLCAGAVCTDAKVSLSIVNCTVVDNQGDTGGIRASSSTPIVNSILWGNQSNVSPDQAQLSTGMAVQYSDIDQDGYDGINGNIRVIPGFVNATDNNFHLQGGSGCIDFGNNDAQYLPATDLDGNNRIIGTRVDMGVYER